MGKQRYRLQLPRLTQECINQHINSGKTSWMIMAIPTGQRPTPRGSHAALQRVVLIVIKLWLQKSHS